MIPPRVRRHLLPALLVAVPALALQVVAIHRQSLTGDGAYHLIAGEQMLRYGENLTNLEHPPLVKLVMALPLLAERAPLLPRIQVDQALAAIDRIHQDRQRLRRVTVRARYALLIAVVLPFLAACLVLGRRFGGSAAGWLLVAMTAFSFSLLPNLAILQTDTGVALGFVLTLVAGDRYLAGGGRGTTAALIGLALGVAMASKHSGLLLVPTVLSVLAIAGHGHRRWVRSVAHGALAAAMALAVVGASYAVASRGYDPGRGREAIERYCHNRGTLVVGGAMEDAEPVLLALERRAPRLAQWLLGMHGIAVQNAIGIYPSYAFGAVRPQGRWWYFPAVLLVKTPLAILVAAGALLGLRAWHRRRPPRLVARFLPPALTVAVYLGVAMSSSYNLGFRHLMPIVPLLLLPVAVGLARYRTAATAVVLTLAIEAALLAPLWMSATNTWWLGERNPTRFALSLGNLEYKQNFVQLAREAEARGIESLRVIYPALGEPVLRAYLPSAELVRPDQRRLEPGWYAVNVMVEQYLPALMAAPSDPALARLASAWAPAWRAVSGAGEDHGYLAATFHLYRLPTAQPLGGAAADR